MRESLLRKARESAEVARGLLERDAPRFEACVRAMAARFQRGGRLFVMGNGGSACDAQHVAVEFLHPIVEKRRALPAIALTTDTATLTAIGNDRDFSMVFADQLRLLGKGEDMALGLSTSGQSANVARGLQAARDAGMLTVGFSGRDGGRLASIAEYCFVAPSFSIHRIQETHTILLHLLWDEVQVSLGEDDVL
ncbi:MAG TPA: SIS domain-containing protein [Vicinamibacteria bacterium]|jgi:D-sedoheptulose 7-phosphate isomerase